MQFMNMSMNPIVAAMVNGRQVNELEKVEEKITTLAFHATETVTFIPDPNEAKALADWLWNLIEQLEGNEFTINGQKIDKSKSKSWKRYDK